MFREIYARVDPISRTDSQRQLLNSS